VIRIIAVRTDATAAANVGGPPTVTYRTFDAECPELEAFFAEREGWSNKSLVEQSVVGVEIVQKGSA
jgi:hypothetical protein